MARWKNLTCDELQALQAQRTRIYAERARAKAAKKRAALNRERYERAIAEKRGEATISRAENEANQ